MPITCKSKHKHALIRHKYKDHFFIIKKSILKNNHFENKGNHNKLLLIYIFFKYNPCTYVYAKVQIKFGCYTFENISAEIKISTSQSKGHSHGSLVSSQRLELPLQIVVVLVVRYGLFLNRLLSDERHRR